MTGRLSFGSIHGRELKREEVAGFCLQEWIYDPGFQFPRHSHASAFLNLPLEGGYTETYGRRTRTGFPFTMIFQPVGEVHSKQFHDTGGRMFDIQIPPPWLERLDEHRVILDGPLEFPGGVAIWLARRLHGEFRRPDNVSPLVMEGLLLEIVGEISRRPSPVAERQPPRWLGQVRDFLHAWFAESLSLEEIAVAIGVHPDHLARVFRQQLRCTVGDYVRQLRVDCACRLLTTSDASLVEIALASGFADQSHFSKVFKRHMKMTPAEFRQHFRLCKSPTKE